MEHVGAQHKTHKRHGSCVPSGAAPWGGAAVNSFGKNRRAGLRIIPESDCATCHHGKSPYVGCAVQRGPLNAATPLNIGGSPVGPALFNDVRSVTLIQ